MIGEIVMIDKNDVMDAIYKFTGRVKRDEGGAIVRDENGNVVYEGGNERWRKVYREAPPLAKRRLVLSWYYSMNKKTIVGDGELNDEFTKLKEAMDKTLEKRDLEYLIDNLGNNPKAVEHYEQLLEALPDDGGEGGADSQVAEGEENEEEAQQQAEGGADGQPQDGQSEGQQV